MDVIGHLNAARFVEAAAARDRLAGLNKELEEAGIVSIYPARYLSWFVDHVVDSGARLLDDGGEIVQVLSDTWGYRPDYYDVGMEERWYDPARAAGRFRAAQQWGAASMYSQGFEDWKGYQWFRVEIEPPAGELGDLHIWFGANDGSTRLWINGEPVTFLLASTNRKTGETTTQEVEEHPRAWRSISAPVGRFLRPGRPNTIVVRLDHALNDLNLGGLLRPVVLYRPGKAVAPDDREQQKIDM